MTPKVDNEVQGLARFAPAQQIFRGEPFSPVTKPEIDKILYWTIVTV